MCNSDLHRKTVASAFWNNELEEELREEGWDNFAFMKVDDREEMMQKIDEKRAMTRYTHINCSEECMGRGKWIQVYVWYDLIDNIIVIKGAENSM